MKTLILIAVFAFSFAVTSAVQAQTCYTTSDGKTTTCFGSNKDERHFTTSDGKTCYTTSDGKTTTCF